MGLLSRVLRPRLEATAHCDLPCGVYDPAQARIEAESVKAIQEKYQGNEDAAFRARAIEIKEQRSDLVKHHLWVLWTDYFRPPARAAPRARTTRPPARICWTTSPRSTRSSGRPSRLPDPGTQSGADQRIWLPVGRRRFLSLGNLSRRPGVGCTWGPFRGRHPLGVVVNRPSVWPDR